jgi:hypothetical protein
MRILFATLAANTHMFNMVPLAWALRAAGHEVCVASGPELIPDTTKAGLMAVAVGPQVDMVEDARQAEYGDTVHGSEYDITEMSPERLTWDYARNVLRVWSQGPVAAFDYLANDPTVDDLVRFSRYWKPDLVVWDATTYAGAIAARVVGAAQVRLLFGLDQVARIHQIFADGLAAQPGEAEDPLVEMITRKLARHDATFDPSLVFGQLTLDPQPDWMRLSHEDSIAYHAVSPTPYNGPSVMPDWLAEPAGRRQICVTLGLSLREIDDHWGEGIKHSTLFEAVDGLDVDVIATASTEDLEGVSIPRQRQGARLRADDRAAAAHVGDRAPRRRWHPDERRHVRRAAGDHPGLVVGRGDLGGQARRARRRCRDPPGGADRGETACRARAGTGDPVVRGGRHRRAEAGAGVPDPSRHRPGSRGPGPSAQDRPLT